MNLLKTTTIMSSLVAASFVMGAGMAKAQTATVPFNGTINPTCVFDNANIVDGVLEVDAADLTLLTTLTPGSVPITCNGGVSLTVADPVTVAAPTATPTVASEATLLTGTTTSGGAPAVVVGPINAELVEVTMTAQGATPLIPGNYSYTVDVTAVPQ